MVHIINDTGECRKNILEAKFRLKSRRLTSWSSTIGFCEIFLVSHVRSVTQSGIKCLDTRMRLCWRDEAFKMSGRGIKEPA